MFLSQALETLRSLPCPAPIDAAAGPVECENGEPAARSRSNSKEKSKEEYQKESKCERIEVEIPESKITWWGV